MKFMTKNLLLFSIFLFIFTFIFRYFLSSLLQDRNFESSWITVIVYAVLVFIVGWVFGNRDNEHLPLYDIGFRFHASTYLICNLIAEFWHLSGYNSVYEPISTVHLTTIIWGIVLLIHLAFYLYTRKYAIRGIKKSELFE
ncbi:MAG: hypothetical protein K9I71_06715 [Ignavibacteriales bacterium]|nr:hypothetical protein [Ignavibacteriales bacterium]MCF8315796.1 hypothetical protein [Ignavibacteriales bacterium]MCF8437256.1 hypothetical protein [Ignavibacteriales bacterium]